MFGYRVQDDQILHPVMMAHLSVFPGLKHLTFGMLYSQHGCPFKCTFCQTQAFHKRMLNINFESIERVVEYYRRVGIRDIVIWDELFGTSPHLADKLSCLLARHGFRWLAQSRAAIFNSHLDLWYERGLRLAGIGVESMNEKNLVAINKKQKINEVLEFARRTSEKAGMYRIVTFMLGYDNMGVKETIEDAKRLNDIGFEVNGTSVMTPYPRTPLWDELESQYGIFERNYRRYDSRHLVWNHPHISPVQMNYLVKTIKGFMNKPRDFLKKSVKRLVLDELGTKSARSRIGGFLKGPFVSLRINDRKMHFFPTPKARQEPGIIPQSAPKN